MTSGRGREEVSCCSSLISGGSLLLRQDHEHLLDRGRRRLFDHELGAAASPAVALARDAPEPEHQMAGDRLGFLSRQIDPEALLELVEAEAAVEQVAPLARWSKTGALFFVELVLD